MERICCSSRKFFSYLLIGKQIEGYNIVLPVTQKKNLPSKTFDIVSWYLVRRPCKTVLSLVMFLSVFTATHYWASLLLSPVFIANCHDNYFAQIASKMTDIFKIEIHAVIYTGYFTSHLVACMLSEILDFINSFHTPKADI